MSQRGYDSKSVIVVVGSQTLQGFAPDSKVTVARNNDAFTTQVGSDGEVARSKTNDKSGRITVQLLQTSPSNSFLQSIATVDENSPSGDGVVPCFVKDLNGSFIATAALAWVMKSADNEFGPEAGTREWIIETGELILGGGGNDELVASAL